MNEDIKKRLENEITLIGSHANNHSFFEDMVNAILQLDDTVKELQKSAKIYEESPDWIKIWDHS